jgi:CMP-N-acetylneuraminic acid synthetase
VLLADKYARVRDACVIYATSPLLSALDLRVSYDRFSLWQVAYLVSVQASPLADAGCFYWCDAQSLRAGMRLYEDEATMVYPLPPERCCDINVQSDWHKAEEMYDNLLRSEEGKS